MIRQVYLNLVLEFVPETIYRIIKHYTRTNRNIPPIHAKLYMYQVFEPIVFAFAQHTRYVRSWLNGRVRRFRGLLHTFTRWVCVTGTSNLKICCLTRILTWSNSATSAAQRCS